MTYSEIYSSQPVNIHEFLTQLFETTHNLSRFTLRRSGGSWMAGMKGNAYIYILSTARQLEEVAQIMRWPKTNNLNGMINLCVNAFFFLYMKCCVFCFWLSSDFVEKSLLILSFSSKFKIISNLTNNDEIWDMQYARKKVFCNEQ